MNESPKSLVKKLKYGTSSGMLHVGPFGSNTMTKCSIKNNGMKLRSSNGFGMTSLSTPKWLGVIEQIKISSFLVMAMLQGFDKTWETRHVLCRRHNLYIEWNWKRQCRSVVSPSVGRLSCGFGGCPWPVGWGWSLV